MKRPALLHFVRHFALPILVAAPLALSPSQGIAYSYATAKVEPLLEGREALFQAAESGFWTAAKIAYKSMADEIAYLDENEAPGIKDEFDAAISAKDPVALRASFTRAAHIEVIRRLTAARNNIENYETAKLMVVAANNFFTAVAAELEPAKREEISQHMASALDSVGNPGVLGVGRRDPDPAAFDAALKAISTVLGPSAQQF